LSKNSFFDKRQCDRGIDRHFSITQGIEKWSELRTGAAVKRVEKGQDGLFQQTERRTVPARKPARVSHNP